MCHICMVLLIGFFVVVVALHTHPSLTAICKCQPWLLWVTVIDGLVSAVKVIASVRTSLPQLSCRSSPFRRPSSITHTHTRACTHTPFFHFGL